MAQAAPALTRVNGSAGRVRRAPALPAHPHSSKVNSYCIICASWHFGKLLERCPRCSARIRRWVPDGELRLYESRGSLYGF
jgi:hypothetical protein